MISDETRVDVALAFAVTSTIVASARAIDDDKLEAWPDSFTADAVYRIMPRENLAANYPIAVIYCRGAAMMHDRVLAIRKASVFGPHCYRHILSPSTIASAGPGTVDASTPLLVVRTKLDSIERGTSELFAAGEYRDTLTLQTGGTWKIASRIVVLDTSLIATQLVMPL